MTVPANYPVISFRGGTPTNTFKTNITIKNPEDLLIVLVDNDLKVRFNLFLGTNYSLSTLDSGATITLMRDSHRLIDGRGFLDRDARIDVRRVVSIDQQTSIKNQGVFFPEVHEDEFDKQIQIDQQQQYELDGAIKVVNDEGEAVGGTIQNRSDSVIGFDESGRLTTEPIGSGSIVDENKLEDQIQSLKAEIEADDSTLGAKIASNKEEIGDKDDKDTNESGTIYERINANKSVVEDNQGKIGRNTDAIQGTGDKSTVTVDAQGKVTLDNRGLIKKVGLYSDKAQDDKDGSLHARMNAEREARLDAVRSIEIGTDQYKSRGLRQLSDLIDVNRGKISKEIERLDIPKQGETKDHALGETLFNNSKDTTSTNINASEASYTIPVIETSNESKVEYPTSKRIKLGDDRASFTAPDRFRMYELTSPFQVPGGIGNIRVWSIFSGNVRGVSRLTLPETIGGINVPEGERGFSISFGAFDSTYWEGDSGRDVLDVTIEGRKVPSSLSIIVPENRNASIYVYLSVADSTFDALEIEGFDDSTDSFIDADLVGLTRSLTMIPRIDVDGQDVSGFAFVGHIPRKAGATENDFWEDIHDQTKDSRTAIEQVFFSLRSPIPAEGLLKFDILKQGRNTISVGAVTKKASVSEWKKVFTGSGGGGGLDQAAVDARVLAGVATHDRNSRAHNDIRLDVSSNKTAIDRTATIFGNIVGQNSQDPTGSGTIFQRIASARGGGGTIEKSYTHEYILAPSTANPLSHHDFRQNFTEEQWNKIINATLVRMEMAKTSSENTSGLYQTVQFPGSILYRVSDTYRTRKTAHFPGIGDENWCIETTGSRGFWTIRAPSKQGIGQTLRAGTSSSRYNFIRLLEIITETFSIS